MTVESHVYECVSIEHWACRKGENSLHIFLSTAIVMQKNGHPAIDIWLFLLSFFCESVSSVPDCNKFQNFPFCIVAKGRQQQQQQQQPKQVTLIKTNQKKTKHKLKNISNKIVQQGWYGVCVKFECFILPFSVYSLSKFTKYTGRHCTQFKPSEDET